MILALDTETTGLMWADTAFAVSWATDDESGVFWVGEDPIAIPRRFDDLVFHNCKFDLHKLAQIGAMDYDHIDHLLREGRIHDTSVMAHLLDENDRKGLKYLAVKWLGIDDTIEVEVKSGPNAGQMRRVAEDEYKLAEARRKLGLKKEDGYHLLPREIVGPYAVRDAEFTRDLFLRFKPRLLDKGLWDVYTEEMQAVGALLRMEREGFGIDLDTLRSLTSEYGQRVIRGELALQKMSGRTDYNPNSQPQTLEILQSRGIRAEDTTEHTLAGLEDEFARTLLQYRNDKKTHTTYLVGLSREVSDGVFHPHFNPTGARTGRLSSSTGG